MAFTYVTPTTVNNIAVGDQVVFAVAADGHAYVYPKPATGSGLKYPTVLKIIPADVPAGTDSAGNPVTNTSVLWTVQLAGASQFSQPIDFTLNATTDWVFRATGTA